MKPEDYLYRCHCLIGSEDGTLHVVSLDRRSNPDDDSSDGGNAGSSFSKPIHERAIMRIAVADRKIATASLDQRIGIMDLEYEHAVSYIQRIHTNTIHSCAFVDPISGGYPQLQSHMLATGSRDRSIAVTDLRRYVRIAMDS